MVHELETGTKKGESDFLEILYDKRLPKFAKKYSEKLGGKYKMDVAKDASSEGKGMWSHVKPVEIEPGKWKVWEGHDKTFDSRREALSYLDKLAGYSPASDYPIHRIDLTPAMRKSINTKGQSFYKVPLAIGGAAMGANLLGGGRQDNGKNQLSEGVQW